MGLECPNGHGRQAVILNITADGSVTARAKDVVARKLACGCVVGGAEYTVFLEKLHEINTEQEIQMEQIRKLSSDKKAAAYLGMSKNNAEVS